MRKSPRGGGSPARLHCAPGVGVSLRRKLAVIALVYVIEGFPMGIFVDVLPVFFRRLGVSKAEIGFLAGLSVAWSLKVLWSPLIDRFGLRRQWISGANVAMAAALLLVARSGADALTAAIWLAVSAYCIASATQDIAIDAYTIGLVDRGEEGPANAMRMTGYRLGVLRCAALPAPLDRLARNPRGRGRAPRGDGRRGLHGASRGGARAGSP